MQVVVEGSQLQCSDELSVDFSGPCAQVQGRGPCPQGHGPPSFGAPPGVQGETRASSVPSEHPSSSLLHPPHPPPVSSSSWTRLLSCPLLFNDRCVVASVQETVEAPQLQRLDAGRHSSCAMPGLTADTCSPSPKGRFWHQPLRPSLPPPSSSTQNDDFCTSPASSPPPRP